MENKKITQFQLVSNLRLNSSINSLAEQLALNLDLTTQEVRDIVESSINEWQNQKQLSAKTIFMMNVDQKHLEIYEILNMLESKFRPLLNSERKVDFALELAQRSLEYGLQFK